MPKLHFDDCFDERKLRKLAENLPETYATLNELAPWRGGRWPSRVRCMSHESIVVGRRHGAGHGYTHTSGRGSSEIRMNPYMSPEGHWLVFVHENLHHAFPDATESEINCVLVPKVYKKVFGKKLEPAWARKHGIGSPEPGVGDRSYCR